MIMRRGISSAVAAWPFEALAQSGKIWRAGFIAHKYESFFDALFEVCASSLRGVMRVTFWAG
jgi:hypothetical protein